jgi:hypothetical protein
MSYQAVMRNGSGALIANTAITFRIEILQGVSTGTCFYSEQQIVTTNENGLATFAIGAGTPIIGTFDGISWGSGPYFIKITDMNHGISSVSELMSVPYALYAKNCDNSGLTLPFLGEVADDNVSFEIKNDLGTALKGTTGKTTGFGIMGIGSGSGSSSVGVLGLTGEAQTYGISANLGVYGRSSAGIGVAGTSSTGTAGYFSTQLGYALRTNGTLLLSGIGEAQGKVLTSDGHGIATWQNPAYTWAQNGVNIGYTKGYVGIGTTVPTDFLSIQGGAASNTAVTLANNSSSKGGLSLGLNSVGSGFLWNYENTPIFLGTNNTTRLTLTGDGKVQYYKTGIAQMLPIAYGFIESAGTISSGTGNFTCTYNTTEKRYDINIPNEYFNTEPVVLVTLSKNANLYFVNTSRFGAIFYIIVQNTSGVRAQSAFSFIIYEPN